MNDDTAFLTAIRDQPTDDILRLVYADWIADNREYLTDWHAATEEYIRLTCGREVTEGEESRWLRANVRRLLPKKYERNNYGVMKNVEGGSILVLHSMYAGHMSIVFHRGFATSARIYNMNNNDMVVTDLVPSMPVAIFSVIGAIWLEETSVYVQEFAPREAWQDMVRDDTETEGLNDFHIFRGPDAEQRATREMDAALRRFAMRQTQSVVLHKLYS